MSPKGIRRDIGVVDSVPQVLCLDDFNRVLYRSVMTVNGFLNQGVLLAQEDRQISNERPTEWTKFRARKLNFDTPCLLAGHGCEESERREIDIGDMMSQKLVISP
jgi:hypothetical protein